MNRFRARGALSALALLGVLGGLPGLAGCSTGSPPAAPPAGSQATGPNSAAMQNPNLDLGTSLGSRPAPDFRLRNQFGQPMSLSQFRGKVVMLAFEVSQGTTVSRRPRQSMRMPNQMLAAPGPGVQLPAVDATPDATTCAAWTSSRRSPGPGAGTVPGGPGQPGVVMFFATWLSEVQDLKSDLTSANAYVAAARREHLPPLVAVDETVVESSAQAVRAYLRGLGAGLDYPAALDTSGRVADGYAVQDQPWLALVSAAGKIIWWHDGWLAPPALES